MNKEFELTKNILSTALHDIYNEINNLFFLSESVLSDCQCLKLIEKDNFQKDFFMIINQIKCKQFIFNNIYNNKIIAINDIKKHLLNIITIVNDSNYLLPINFISILSLLSNNNSMIIQNNILTVFIKKKYIKELENIDCLSSWIIILFKNFPYTYKIENNQLIITIV